MGSPMPPMGPVFPPPGPARDHSKSNRVALIAGAVVIVGALSTGIALAATSHSTSSSTALAPAHQVLPTEQVIPSASPARASTSPTPVATTPAAVQSSAAPAEPAVDGAWAGTYSCNQGLTGMRMTITGSSGDNLAATINFYPVPSNPTVPKGSYAMTGKYSAAGGLVLTPDHWINQPPGYEMVPFSAPGPSGNSMQGTVQSAGCSTFSVTK